MLIVAGVSLKNLTPRVWDPQGQYFLPDLRAIMVSYADFLRKPSWRERAMADGLHALLGVPTNVQVYLDNGSFFASRGAASHSYSDYESFVRRARPDWYPVPRDFIPLPHMTRRQQARCLRRTMEVNLAYQYDGFAPVIHFGSHLEDYLAEMRKHTRLARKPHVALGGLVPNLLRRPKAHAYDAIVDGLIDVRRKFAGRQLHVFGVGGTATLHLAALLEVDSLDSSGWRNRAARGIVQLPGSGDRVMAELGSWRGRRPSDIELAALEACQCPACCRFGAVGLRERGLTGFANRACHNLWTLLQEAAWLEKQLSAGSYRRNYRSRLDNSVYLPIIERILGAHQTVARPQTEHPHV